MRCGNCKGNHDTVAEVKACYGIGQPQQLVLSAQELMREHGVNVARTPVPSALQAKPRTEVRTVDDPFAFPTDIEVPEWGTYTVVLGEERRTIMFVLAERGGLKGKVIIKYLSGPDNTSNYTAFANATDDRRGVRVWKRYKDDSQLIDHLKFLLRKDDAALLHAREAYALMSEKCSKCRRKLTVPASINRGLGPKCAQGGWD